jgi:beta-glucosidase
MTHNSQEMGHALADVLFGQYNPAGRLNQTWPASLDQLPDMLDYDITNGRTYMYMKDEPLFHFGYGLSYTTLAYDNLTVSETEIKGGQEITVRVDVTNTGARDGEEVVQLYVSFPNSGVTRPVKALKGFKRVAVAAGETVTVEMPLKASQLTYWHAVDQRFTLEQGEVKLMIASASNDVRLDETITVVPD